MLINTLIAEEVHGFDIAIYPNRQHSISEEGTYAEREPWPT